MYEKYEKDMNYSYNPWSRINLEFDNFKYFFLYLIWIYKIIVKPDLAGRMIGWSVELSEFDIRYEPRVAIKSQWLTDFLVELMPQSHQPIGWTIYVDGSSNKTSCGAEIKQALKFKFRVTNNQVEYEVILICLNLAYNMGARELTCRSDSQLVVGQMKGEFEVKNPLLQRYYHTVSGLIFKFAKVNMEHIYRKDNVTDNTLSRLFCENEKPPSINYPRCLKALSVGLTECLWATEVETWITPIKKFLELDTYDLNKKKTIQ